ncbi:hypothetical protein DICVIV_06237 [Dictyocaulus viviparus]|uniref:Uncharacterized protein n=1 Tax=Dictyocaulus viviparus TaxID=29172 RepID=A0A0D8XT31_DICVI|nr:hypothetical protein DICVIV_06237 [Dictyocaulus viviparus]
MTRCIENDNNRLVQIDRNKLLNFLRILLVMKLMTTIMVQYNIEHYRSELNRCTNVKSNVLFIWLHHFVVSPHSYDFSVVQNYIMLKK